MKIAAILKSFINIAEMKSMDLSGDKARFFKPKTAKAWMAFLQKAQSQSK